MESSGWCCFDPHRHNGPWRSVKLYLTFFWVYYGTAGHLVHLYCFKARIYPENMPQQCICVEA
ncbi:hypothetical protein BJY04DRAFT_200189 [Aspergillus karnatakaensis]|uniref:uncharacterized protein n=1 Tax=Aspergillus karnatakaensis TaxID=1810916 RepID=UPI003CCD406A